MRILCVLAVTIAFSGCGTSTKPARPTLNTDDNEAECVSSGGRPATNSMITFVCKWPSTDAGKSCTDNSQCQGICEVPESAYRKREPRPDPLFPEIVVIGSNLREVPAAGTPMTGVCSAWRADGKATNCKTYVAKGRVAEHVCYD